MITPNRLRLIGMRVYYVHVDGPLMTTRAIRTALLAYEQILCERYNIDGD